MTKYLILFLFIPSFLFGQVKKEESQLKIRDEIQKTPKTELILVIENERIKLDSISAKKIDPIWIRKIEIVKKEEYKNIYGNWSSPLLIGLFYRWLNKHTIS